MGSLVLGTARVPAQGPPERGRAVKVRSLREVYRPFPCLAAAGCGMLVSLAPSPVSVASAPRSHFSCFTQGAGSLSVPRLGSAP